MVKIDYTLQYIRSALDVVQNLLSTDWTPDTPNAPVKELRVRLFLLREQLSQFLEHGDAMRLIQQAPSLSDSKDNVNLLATSQTLLRDFGTIYNMAHQDFLQSQDAVPQMREQVNGYLKRFEDLVQELKETGAV